MAIEKEKVLMNSFFDSQFNNCPLVWICHGRRNNTKINNNLHERCLRLRYSDKKSSYEELLEKMDKFLFTIGIFRHLHATEMYKVKCGYTPKIFNDLFHQREISLYNL